MHEADRRFARIPLVVVGPLFIAGGYLAAFTVEGALFVFLGLGMLTCGLLLSTRLPARVAALVGAIVTLGLALELAIELRG